MHAGLRSMGEITHCVWSVHSQLVPEHSMETCGTHKNATKDSRQHTYRITQNFQALALHLQARILTKNPTHKLIKKILKPLTRGTSPCGDSTT